MTVDTNREHRAYGAVLGRQESITGTNANVAGTLALGDVSPSAGLVATLSGATLATGSFYYAIPCGGCATLDVTLRMSAHTGTVATITLYPTLKDQVTIKGTATSVTTLVDAAQATTSVLTLRGERVWILKIVVPSSASITFDQAEFSAL